MIELMSNHWPSAS